MTAETELFFDKSGNPIQRYKCRGQAYFISEEICNNRQKEGYFKGCNKCSLKIGGKNDPRKTLKERG